MTAIPGPRRADQRPQLIPSGPIPVPAQRRHGPEHQPDRVRQPAPGPQRARVHPPALRPIPSRRRSGPASPHRRRGRPPPERRHLRPALRKAIPRRFREQTAPRVGRHQKTSPIRHRRTSRYRRSPSPRHRSNHSQKLQSSSQRRHRPWSSLSPLTHSESPPGTASPRSSLPALPIAKSRLLGQSRRPTTMVRYCSSRLFWSLA